MRDKITFVNFCTLSDAELLEILKMRNCKQIRQQMCNLDEIDADEHLRFCHALKDSSNLFYYAVYLNSTLVGVIDFKLKDPKLRSFESGAYFLNVSSQVSTAAIQSSLNICRKLDLRQAFIMVRKDNEKALLFNILKMKYHLISEDEQFYYLEGLQFTLEHPENLAWLERINLKINNNFEIVYRL